MVQKKRRRTRLGRDRLAEKIHQMLAAGMSKTAIAEELGIARSTIYNIIKHGGESYGGEGRFKNSSDWDETGPDPIPYDELSDDLKELLEFTPQAFERFFLRYSGEDYFPNHIRKIANLVFSHDWVVVNIPPRHAKSTVFSAWFPVWLLTRDRQTQIILTSQSFDQAMKHARKIEAILSGNRKLVNDFGRFKPISTNYPWRPAKGELMIEGRIITEQESGDLSLQIRGAGQGILGMEADWIIGDDVADIENSNSEAKRKELFDWWHGEVLSRAEPTARAVVLGTRFHAQDLYGALSRVQYEDEDDLPIKAWHHHVMPAVLDWDNKQVLWPERFKNIAYFKRQRAHDRVLFEAMYQQDPIAPGSQLARPEWFTGDDEHLGCNELDRRVGDGMRNEQSQADWHGSGLVPVVRVLSMDPSPSNYWGIVVADVPWVPPTMEDRFFWCHVIELKRDRMGIREAIQEIERVWEMYGPIDYFIFEKNLFARWFLSYPELQRWQQRVRVIGHETAKNKADPRYGVESLATDFELARVRLPYADAESRMMSDLLIEEATTYPQGKTDDILMALWFIKYQHQNLYPVLEHQVTKMPVGAANPSPGKVGGWSRFQRGKRRWR